jgi:hypothetical protein
VTKKRDGDRKTKEDDREEEGKKISAASRQADYV